MSNPFGAPTDSPGDDDFEVDLPEQDEDGGGKDFSVPEGEYLARCIALTKDISKKGNTMWVWDFSIATGKYQGKEFKTYTALTPAAMWKLTEVCVALGLSKGGERAKFKKSDAIGKYAVISLEDDEYNGTKKSTIASLRVAPTKAIEAAKKGDDVPF